MRAFRLLLPLVCVISASVVQSETILVPSQQPTIQAGIEAAEDGDTVLVADGTYTGDGNRDVDFGGKPIVVMSENGPDVTIIDCEGTPSEPHRGFWFHSGEGHDSILKGFTITNGQTWMEESGGAIRCEMSSPTIVGNIIKWNQAGSRAFQASGAGIACLYSSAPILEKNKIISNWATYSGGGILCYESSPMIVDNLILDNIADGAGGGVMCASFSSPQIVNNTVKENYTGGGGGGILCTGSSDPLIKDNDVLENTASVIAGGIYCHNDASPVIEGNLVLGNSAPRSGGIGCWTDACPMIRGNWILDNTAFEYFGGGIGCEYNSTATIESNTISGNTAQGVSGGGLWCHQSYPTVANSILWGDSPDEIYVTEADLVVTYSNVQAGWTGEGNINEDPLFVLPQIHDCRLLWGSPCVDSGNPDLMDPDGTRIDMGARCFNQLDYLTLYITPDMTVVPPGGELGVTYTVINRWNWPQSFWVMSTIAYEGGATDIIVGPDKYKLPKRYTAQVHTVYNVPPDAPQGVYDYWSGVGLPPGIVFDEDSFKYSVIE